MKKILVLFALLFFVNVVFAQNITNTSSTTTATPSFTDTLKGIYSLLLSVNPILLLILGVILILVAKLAKFVAIVLIIIAIIHLIFLFWK